MRAACEGDLPASNVLAKALRTPKRRRLEISGEPADFDTLNACGFRMAARFCNQASSDALTTRAVLDVEVEQLKHSTPVKHLARRVNARCEVAEQEAAT